MAQGTKRDVKVCIAFFVGNSLGHPLPVPHGHCPPQAVEQCLETDLGIMSVLMAINLPGSLGKKLGPLGQAVKKLEGMLYELSLMQHGRSTAVVVEEPEPKEDQKADD